MADDDSGQYSIFSADPAKPGSGIVFDTPKRSEFFEQLYADAADRIAKGLSLVEGRRGSIDLLHRDYERERQSEPSPQPPPTPRPPPVPSLPAAPPPAESKPAGDESAAQLGAPQLPPGQSVDIEPPKFTVPAWEPGGAVVRQSDPIPSDEVLNYVYPPIAGDAETQARIDNHQPLPNEPELSGAAPFARAPMKRGDPVDLFSGRFTLATTDLVVPTAVTTIAMQRTYRSGPGYYGPFGRGWDHCYNVYLRRLFDDSIAFWPGRLQELRFSKDSDGIWVPGPGLCARLISGEFDDEYFLVHPGGLRWHFKAPPGWGNAERIPLVEIIDRNDNKTHLTYDHRDRVEQVLDDNGRGLIFSYGQCDLLELVTDHTQTRRVEYHHSPEIEHLARVVLPETAQFPGGVPTEYEYDDYAAHPAMRDNLLRVVDADGQTCLENDYAGPDAGWAFNSVATQLSAGFEYRFEYEQIQYVPPDTMYVDVPAARTNVVMPDGALHVYTFNYRGDLLDHRFRLCRDGSFRIIATQFAYDAQGNMALAVGPDGLRMEMTFDDVNPDPCARRNLLEIAIAAPLPNLTPSRTLQRIRYDDTYQLPISVRDEKGNLVRYIYDFDQGLPAATGLLLRVEQPTTEADDVVEHKFSYNARGQVVEHIAPGGSKSIYRYIEDGSLENGFLDHVTRDATGAALSTDFTYDTVGHINRVTSPGGRIIELHHNKLGQLEEVVAPQLGGLSAAIRCWYADDGNPVRVERPRGDYSDAAIVDNFIVDTYERNVAGHVTAVSYAGNTAVRRALRQKVDHDGRPTRATDPAGVNTDRVFDERGLLLRETRAAGTPDEATTTFDYDRAGRLTGVTDPAGWKTKIHHDRWGRVDRLQLPSGAIHTATWGAQDQLLETVVSGATAPGEPARPLTRQSFVYDIRGRLASTTDYATEDDPTKPCDELVTRYEYDLDDNIKRVSYPRGATEEFEYDGLGRIVGETDVYGTVRNVQFNAIGDVETVTASESANGAVLEVVTSFEYDDRGRLSAAQTSSGRTEFDYDSRDVVVVKREPGGVATRVTTNPFGNVTNAALDPAGLNINSRWEFDDLGRLSTFTDSTGATTSWQRDLLGRVRNLTMPDGRNWQYRYNLEAGQVEQTTPSGSRLTWTSNAIGQPVKLECTAGAGTDPVPVHDFEYDSLSRLVRAKLPTHEIERRYDSIGRQTWENTQGKSVRLSYNDIDGYADLTYVDGRRERTQYDAAGRPIRITLETPGGALGGVAGDELVAIEYASHPTKIKHSNGITTTITYDQPGRLVSLKHATIGGSEIDGYRARYDERGRRALTQLSGRPSRSTLHTFDSRDRLTSAQWGFPFPPLPDAVHQADHPDAIQAAEAASTNSTVSQKYVLDKADGRTQRILTSGNAPDVIETNTLAPDHSTLQAASSTIVHHPDGPRAKDNRREYDIDALGRIVRIQDIATGQTIATFNYDALSRVEAGTLAGQSFERQFLGTNWIQENRGVAAEIRQSTPHPLWPQPLCVHSVASNLFVHPDEGASTLCVVDDLGTVRERHRYGPFGEPELYEADGTTRITPESAAVEPRWRAMPLLTPIGMYESAQRLYDPSLGIFLARDPHLYVDSPSPWVFAAHNPVDFLDPTGTEKSGPGESLFDKAPTVDPRCQPLLPPPPNDWMQKYGPRTERELRRPTTDGPGSLVVRFEGTDYHLDAENAASYESYQTAARAREMYEGVAAAFQGLRNSAPLGRAPAKQHTTSAAPPPGMVKLPPRPDGKGPLLPIVHPYFESTKSSHDVVQGWTMAVHQKLSPNTALILKNLEPHQVKLAGRSTAHARIVYGNAVETAMAKAVEVNGLLIHTGDIRPAPRGGPDFVGAPGSPLAGALIQIKGAASYESKKGDSPPETVWGLYPKYNPPEYDR